MHRHTLKIADQPVDDRAVAELEPPAAAGLADDKLGDAGLDRVRNKALGDRCGRNRRNAAAERNGEPQGLGNPVPC